MHKLEKNIFALDYMLNCWAKSVYACVVCVSVQADRGSAICFVNQGLNTFGCTVLQFLIYQESLSSEKTRARIISCTFTRAINVYWRL